MAEIENAEDTLLTLTADIVAAHVSNNSVAVNDLPNLIQNVHGALAGSVPALPGQTLQIVPAGPIPEVLGKKITYRVLYQGRPVAGARLIADFINDPDAKEQVTGADGTVTMAVRNQGLNVIRAVYEGPSDNPARYRNVELTATLSFTLQHKPE